MPSHMSLIFAIFGVLSGLSTLINASNDGWYDPDYVNTIRKWGAIELIVNGVIVLYLFETKDLFSNEPIQMPPPQGQPPQ